MAVAEQLPNDLQNALDKDVLKRLPLTFLPFVNQQLKQWNNLFPNERRAVENLLLYVASLSPEESSGLFREVIELEEKMGVRHWQFSTNEQTIQNSSQLARSPFFQEWRLAVRAVFEAADRNAQETRGAALRVGNRLILLDIPKALPLDAAIPWERWKGIGRPINIDLRPSEQSRDPFEFLLTGGVTNLPNEGIFNAARSRPNNSIADTWVVDAGQILVDAVLSRDVSSPAGGNAILLSYSRLDACRQNFSHEMNSMRKDLADADAVFDHLRTVEVTPWCPPEVAGIPAVREFVRSLYLSGNGAVIFGNSFVEWAASEAFRRARPSFLAAKFGVRSKPKPFTGVAVFENPDQINPLPAVDDFTGSAVDAQILALYVWLAASRYDEYQRSTVCVCLAESLSQAYIVSPPEFTLSQHAGPITIEELGRALRNWIA
jgi:hypothetical protein